MQRIDVFQSVDWTGKRWIIFFGVWIMFCFILGGLLLVSYFAVWNSTIQAIYTEMLFWQQKLYKNLGWASVSSSFLSSGGLLDFRNAPHDCFVQPEHPFLAELFFPLWSCTQKGCWGWGMKHSNKRKPHSGHGIPFTCREVVGLCCKDVTSEDKYSFPLSSH